MADKVWKAFERTVARFFGTERTPGSGSAGTFSKSNNPVCTTSDTLHERLYVEAKRDKNFLGRQLLRLLDKVTSEAGKEKKIPVIALKEHGRHNFYILVRSDHIVSVAREAFNAKKESRRS